MKRYNDAPSLALVPTPANDEQWQKRLQFARDRREWALGELGANAGRGGCLAPSHLIQPGDGQGWIAQREVA